MICIITRGTWRSIARAGVMTGGLAGVLLVGGAPGGALGAQETSAPHWAYDGPDNPSRWGALDSAYAACGVGRAQSPIDIRGARSAALPALTFDYHPVPLTIIDNGHTVQITYAPGSTLTVGDRTYTLRQFHFHHPAEERVGGRPYPLVAHLVHADSAGHLAVVAVLFDSGAANPTLDLLWQQIPTAKGVAQTVAGVTIQAADLLPARRGYYTFSGSLTIPPCTEGVTWYVLKAHAPIAPGQVAAFAALYPDNARPLQPRNGRPILETR